MTYYVYILRCIKDGKRYIGFTENLDRRVNEHQSGKVKSTRNRDPLELIYYEKYESKSEEMCREKFFKTHHGRNFLDSINK